MIQLTLKWYNNTLISRKAVNDIIIDINTFIRSHYIPFLVKLIENELSESCPTTTINQVRDILLRNCEPFKPFLTEESRFTIYKHESMYVQPESNQIDASHIDEDDHKPKGILSTTSLKTDLSIAWFI